MNTEVIVARNTNGYDMGKELIRQIPFIGALALSWKSMDVAENIADAAIDSFNRGTAQAAPAQTGDVYNDNSVATNTTTTTGDTISTVDSSDSGNSSSADVSSTVDSSGSGNSADTTTTTTYTDSLNADNSNQGNPSTVTYPVSP